MGKARALGQSLGVRSGGTLLGGVDALADASRTTRQAPDAPRNGPTAFWRATAANAHSEGHQAAPPLPPQAARGARRERYSIYPPAAGIPRLTLLTPRESA